MDMTFTNYWMHEVFVSFGMVKVEIGVLIALTKTFIIPDISNGDCNNCLFFIVLKKVTINGLFRKARFIHLQQL